MAAGSFEVVGFGAGAQDFYLPVGVVGPDHEPGAKAGWTPADEQSLAELRASDPEAHIGGNVVNTLSYLACVSSLTSEVSFVSALGTDETSQAIRTDLARHRVTCAAESHDDYLPSVSIIERLSMGSDRMVRGRPRTPLDTYISDRQIQAATDHADVVVAASLKSAELANRIFAQTPEGTFISYNPGSSEFNHPDELIDVMRRRKPNLLALNDEELIKLLGAQPDADPFELAAEANRYAHNVLCTLGKDGVLLATNGEVIHQDAAQVPAAKVVDTLGAGDRAHAVALDGLLDQRAGELILRTVVGSTGWLIQHVGAHGDLYKPDPWDL